MGAIAGIWDLLSLIGMGAAVTVCFLKGKSLFAWLGIVITGLGAAMWFPLYHAVRNREISEGLLWLWMAQGAAILVVMGAIALGSPEPGSWWERRYGTTNRQ